MRRGATIAAAFAAFARVSSAHADDACLDAASEARTLLAQRSLVAARTKLVTCASSTCEASVRDICVERLGEIATRLPTIIFDAKKRSGEDIVDVKLSVDGVAYSEGPLGQELAFDPGPHVFEFEIPNAPPVTLHLVLVEREKARRQHVVFEPPAEPVRSSDVTCMERPPPEKVERASPLVPLGWLALGAGAVGLGVGTAFGIRAIDENSDAHCDAANVCVDPRARHDARSAATVSTIGIVAGGALVLGGVGMLVFENRSRRTALVVGSGATAASLGISGRW
jgi:hypothetical protein